MFKKKPHTAFFFGGGKASLFHASKGGLARLFSSRALLLGGRAQGDLQIGPAEKGTRPTLSASEVRAAAIPGDP